MTSTAFRILRKILKLTGYALFLLVAVWGLLEVAYRHQWIDFYADEWRGLNQPTSGDNRPVVLVFGDSFSAQPFSYVQVLRDSLPAFRILNSAVPGTGILEARAMAKLRFSQIHPEIVVYQVYTGNDLWDLRKTCDSPNISRIRNGYWWLSDRSLFLRFLNYRLGQWKNRTGTALETRELKTDLPFSPQLYSARERLIFRAEPDLVQNTVQASGSRGIDLQQWLMEMDRWLKLVPQSTRKVLITVAPHCAQVNPLYAGNMEQIGAAPFPATNQEPDYPFLRQMRDHFSSDARIEVVSPLYDFQRADSTGHRLYYENDPHLNPEGQKILGRILLPYLR